MKTYIVILILLIDHCVCTEHNYDVETTSTELNNDQDTEEINYPCSTSDMRCIREFFSKHGRCKLSCGSVPDPYRIKRFEFKMATSNLSYVLVNVELKGLNGKITSFYTNKKTDNLVLAFEVKNMTMSSPQMTFIYNRKGKEPIKLTDVYFVTYGMATFTAIIPNIKHLDLEEAYVYAYLDDCNPNYGLGPKLSNSCDPVVQEEYKDLLTKIPDAAKEALIVQAYSYAKIFIQNKICDFGLKITNPR